MCAVVCLAMPYCQIALSEGPCSFFFFTIICLFLLIAQLSKAKKLVLQHRTVQELKKATQQVQITRRRAGTLSFLLLSVLTLPFFCPRSCCRSIGTSRNRGDRVRGSACGTRLCRCFQGRSSDSAGTGHCLLVFLTAAPHAWS